LITLHLQIRAPCNDKKISELKKYNLVFLSNFFNGVIPMKICKGQNNEYQHFALVSDKKMTTLLLI